LSIVGLCGDDAEVDDFIYWTQFLLKIISITEHLAQKSIDKVESTDISSEDDKESREPDYDEDKDRLEEEQEENTGEVMTNQVLVDDQYRVNNI
jgi:hypothetical protein